LTGIGRKNGKKKEEGKKFTKRGKEINKGAKKLIYYSRRKSLDAEFQLSFGLIYD